MEDENKAVLDKDKESETAVADKGSLELITFSKDSYKSESETETKENQPEADEPLAQKTDRQPEIARPKSLLAIGRSKFLRILI